MVETELLEGVSAIKAQSSQLTGPMDVHALSPSVYMRILLGKNTGVEKKRILE